VACCQGVATSLLQGRRYENVMMKASFREVEHAGWTARAESYDAALAAVTAQAIPHMLAALGDDFGTGSLLDVCCGPGHLAGAANARGARAEGVDFATSMIALAQRNYPAVSFREADAECLPYPDACFDAVTCAFAVMHMERPDLAIAEAFRVLRPGGVFAFTQWAADDELLAMVAAAVAAHGNPNVDGLPPTPPLMRFSDPGECQRTLLAHGFEAALPTRIDLVWRGDRPEAVLDLIHGGAVRAAMLIEAQAPLDRQRINSAILEVVSTRRALDGGYLVRRPAVVAHGRKPAIGSPGA
jgi:ubiquinone/menaquinone biosynthesis C-methylase UbiE